MLWLIIGGIVLLIVLFGVFYDAPDEYYDAHQYPDNWF